MTAGGTRHITTTRVEGASRSLRDDDVAVEEPLEIRLGYDENGARLQKPISITMRTPGHDRELAAGFLFSEGIVRHARDIEKVEPCGAPSPNGYTNTWRVDLRSGVPVDLDRLHRNFYTTSSCGVCGKSSLEALQTVSPPAIDPSKPLLDATTLQRLPQRLHEKQEVFASTGGLHAAALFTPTGELLEIREDVGRHNAVDKLVGTMLLRDSVPLGNQILLLSGRASFELMQKALMAGIGFVAAVGAPSSLAIELAETYGVTLVGFLRDDRFNIYSAPQRLGR
jgi:FdhD protein